MPGFDSHCPGPRYWVAPTRAAPTYLHGELLQNDSLSPHGVQSEREERRRDARFIGALQLIVSDLARGGRGGVLDDNLPQRH